MGMGPPAELGMSMEIENRVMFSWSHGQRALLAFMALLFFVTPAGAEPALILIDEVKLAKLLPPLEGVKKLEASGVAAHGEQLYIVFDNIDQVGRIAHTLRPHPTNGWLELQSAHEGFEGIAVEADGRISVVVEQDRKKQAHLLSWLAEPRLHTDAPIHADGMRRFRVENKGYEGMAIHHHQGEESLFLLCEGNRCMDDGGEPQGVIHRYIRNERQGPWRFGETLSLKGLADFKDYSGLAIDDQGRIAVVSQKDAKVWIGQLLADGQIESRGIYTIDESRFGEGAGQGRRLCGNKRAKKRVYKRIEGVSWLGRERLVMVSDKEKKSCKSQAVHLFRIP
uniref:Phytase-like domain-containing protein n=1 Tax=Magnetococcus massalia (strain MO-1) TaxID=451514 RepID=A0A1S7LI53_MAGMO|nr:protein of unknown function [Candidatus Magnetococcus massalia]